MASATYADLADLSDSAPLVLRVQLRKLAQVEPERAPGVRLGWGRFYAEARTLALLSGNASVGEALRYLVDLPLDARGRPPRLVKQQMLLFARAVEGRPGELQLVAPDAQLVWTEPLETKLRGILTELAAADRPARVTGVREAMSVPGNLAGESETQIFLGTKDGSAASITVTRRPDEAPAWGASFSEVLEGSRPPEAETLAWYRLACFLPRTLPHGVNVSYGGASQVQAEADYALVIRQLGPCPRSRIYP